MKSDYELSIEYNRTYISKKKVYLVFNINILKFNEAKIEKEELEKRLKNKLIDKQFFKIFKFSNKEVVYEFDLEKWFKKSITETIVNTPDMFEKKIRIGKMPITILNNVDQTVIEKLINESFRNYIEKNSKIKKAIINSVSCIVKPSLSYFTFKYDSYFNTINFSLKPEFRIKPSVLYKIDSINKPKKEIKKMGFDKSVYTLLKINTK